jgi:hypothetical protein
LDAAGNENNHFNGTTEVSLMDGYHVYNTASELFVLSYTLDSWLHLRWEGEAGLKDICIIGILQRVLQQYPSAGSIGWCHVDSSKSLSNTWMRFGKCMAACGLRIKPLQLRLHGGEEPPNLTALLAAHPRRTPFKNDASIILLKLQTINGLD